VYVTINISETLIGSCSISFNRSICKVVKLDRLKLFVLWLLVTPWDINKISTLENHSATLAMLPTFG